MFASATLRPPSGSPCRTRAATHGHSARKQVHNGIATAENGDSYANVYERLFQGLLFVRFSGPFNSGVPLNQAARSELFSSRGAVW